MSKKLCILLQTNDEYEFLWEGLFLSWHLNWLWTEFPWPVFVITETKEFSSCHPACNWITLKVGEDVKYASHYSTKLVRGLNQLEEMGYEFVFYGQDDSWPECAPDSSILRSGWNLFLAENLDGLYVHQHSRHFPFSLGPTKYVLAGKRVRQFMVGSRFAYNHGNGWWRIPFLKAVQVTGEHASDNEPEGTIRAWEQGSKIWIVNVDWYDQSKIHVKGVLKPEAEEMLSQLRFSFRWETEEKFACYPVAFDGSIIPVEIGSSDWTEISDAQRWDLYSGSHGPHFSYAWESLPPKQ